MADDKRKIYDPYGFAFGPKKAPPKKVEYASPDRIEADAAARRDKLLAHKQKAPTPEQDTMPEMSGPPLGLMQQYNMWLPIQEVNKKVDQITSAHTKVTGTSPSPGLVRDLLINDPVITKAAVSYSDMFSRSNTPLKAWRGIQYKGLMEQARYLGKHGFGHEIGFPGVDEEDWGIPGLYNTVAPEGSKAYQDVAAYNGFVVAQAKTTREGLAGLFGDMGFLRSIGEAVLMTPMVVKAINIKGDPGELIASQLEGTIADRYLGRPTRDAIRGFNQIQSSFLDLPQGLILTGNALVLDAKDAPSLFDVASGKAPVSSLVPKRSWGIVKQGAYQIKEDFTNPEENIGYLALDIFGAASVGAGTYIRLGEGLAGRAIAREAVRQGDIRAPAFGDVALYRPAAAETIDLGGVQTHRFFRTPEEARVAAGEGADIVRVDLPAEQLSAYTKVPETKPVLIEGEAAPESAAAVSAKAAPEGILLRAGLETTPVTPPGRIAASSFVLGSTAKGLLARPVGGSGVYGFSEFSVTVPYFDNALARLVQKGYLKMTLGKLEARQLNGEFILGDGWLDNLFAPERKVRSILDTEQELRIGMMQAPLLALQRYKRWDSVGKQILNDLFTQPRAMSSFLALHEKEGIAMEKAALLLATDSDHAIADWTAFHNSQIEQAQRQLTSLEEAGPDPTKSHASYQAKLDAQNYKITAHKANLEAIDLALKLIANPTPLWEKVHGQMVRVARIRDEIQRTTLGMDDRTMDQSVAAVQYQLHEIETGFEREPGRFVYERGVEDRVAAMQNIETAQAEVAAIEERLKDAQAKAGSRKAGPTERDRAVIQQIQDELDLGRETVATWQGRLQELGGEPEKIPLTRTVIAEQEVRTRAIRQLQIGMGTTPNLEIQRAITFLEQGEHPVNVAAYLGQMRDRWGDPETWVIEDPAWDALQGVEEAIDTLGGVPIDNVLYGRPRERLTPQGRLVNEFRLLEGVINRARAEGIDPESLPEWRRWEELGARLDVDPHAIGTLRPDDPAVFAEVMRRAGADMVKSERQANLQIETAQANLDAIDVARIDPLDTLDEWRRLEAEMIEVDNRHFEAIEQQPEVPLNVGSADWELWARNVGYTDADVATARAFIAMSERMGVRPWISNVSGEFEGPLSSALGYTDEGLLDAIRQSQRLNDDWYGWTYEDARRFEELRLGEAHAFLDGDVEGARELKAEQMLLEEKYIGDNQGMPMGTVISHEELSQRAYQAVVPENIQQAQQRLNEIRSKQAIGSFHVPQRREVYRENQPRLRRLFHRMTNHGFLPPKAPDSHRMRTGRAIIEGDLRMDTSNLLIEQYGDVLRIGSALQLHRQLFRSHAEGGPALDVGSMTAPDSDAASKLTEWHQPIRDIRDAPVALQRFVQTLQRLDTISPKDLQLMRKEMDSLAAFLYPSKEDAAQIAAEGGHVRWVDQRFITQKPMGLDVNVWRNLDTGFGQILGPTNEIWRLMLLFASPAYALNALGSGMLLLTKQGFLAPVNLGRAIASRHIYGEEVTRILDAMAGNTHAMSYLPDSEKNLFTAMSRTVTNAWQYLTDTHFRRAAIIHELRRRGLLKDNLSPEELADQLLSNAPEVQRIVTEATHAGRNGMLNFNRMSWPERAIARHIFFIYSFMRASAAYSLHYLFEHPAQHAALSAVGRERENLIKELIGDHLPQWFYDQGWIAIGPGEVINPSQINMAGVLNQLSNPLHAMFQQTPYGDATGFAQGGVVAFTELLTGRSLETGERFDRGAAAGTALDMWMKTPLGRVWDRKEKEGEEQVPPPMSVSAASANPIEAARASERAALDMSSFQVDGWWDTWGRFLGRSAVPQHPNVPALQARHWRDIRHSDPQAYAQHERDLVQEMVTAQEEATGRTAPPEVRAAVDFVAQYVQHMNDWREGKVKGYAPPKDPNVRMTAYETLRWLKEEGLLSNEDYRLRMANVRNPAITQAEVQREAIGAMWETAGKPWQKWNDQVKKVDFFAHEDYPVVVQRIDADGLGDFSASADATQEQKWSYGRQALSFSERLAKMRTRASTLTGDEQVAALDQIRRFEDINDRPVVIDNVEFPPLSLAGDRDSSYARQTEPERRQWVLARQTRSWGNLSNFEKRVLTGVQRSPAVTLGWRTLHQWIAADRERLQPGKKLPSGLTKYYAEAIGRQVPAFKKDWEEATAPLAQRMLSFSSIKNSRFSDEWTTMLTDVADYAKGAYEGGWPQGALGDTWKRDGVPQLSAWISRQDTGFRAEVQTYIDENPNFLIRLVKS